MKRKLQLKQKIMIGAGASLLGAAAIVTPLAITLSRTHTNVIDDLDNQYGLDRTIYNNMKGDLTNKYRAKLEHDEEEDIDAKMAQLASSLLEFDNAIQRYEQQQTANVYMAATSNLMQTAKFDYGVDLVRNSRANWNEVDEMFDGMSQSFETYMSNHDFDREQINEVLATALNQKEAMVAQLKTEYANDILGGVLKAKTQLLSCFDSINTEIARLAAEIRLVDFTSNYVFQYIEVEGDGTFKTDNRLDVIKGLFVEGQPIHNDIMNKIFKCYNATTRQEIDFDSDNMLPGYKLIPVFAGTVENPLTNEYSIKIDWRAVANTFADTEDAEKATAHLVDVDQQFTNNIITNKYNIKTIDDFFDHANEKIKLTEYKMLVTSDFESQQLANTYFNGSENGANIEFVWEDRFHPCYDGFMYVNQSLTTDQTLNLRQLAMTNIAIKATGCETRLLKDVIATVEQENYEPKDIIESFVKNCDIVDTVKINKSGNATSVTNKFSANYKNQVRWDAHGQKSIGAIEFGEPMTAPEELQISEVFFEQANEEYNMQHRDSYLLLDKKYDSLYTKGTVGSVFSGLAVGIHIAAQVCYLCKIIVLLKTGQILFGILHLLLFLMTGGLLGFEITFGILYIKHYLSPMLDYKNNADKFHAEKTVINKVKNGLSDDLKYYVLIDKDHHYDPQTYNEKLQQFRGLQKEQQQALFTKYHYFKTDFAVDFFSLAKEHHVDPTQFKEDFSEWKNPAGEYSKVSGWLAVVIALVVGWMGHISDKVTDPNTKQTVDSQNTASQNSQVAADECKSGAQEYL